MIMKKFVLLFILPLFTAQIKGTDTEIIVDNATSKTLTIWTNNQNPKVIPPDTTEIVKQAPPQAPSYEVLKVGVIIRQVPPAP